jgi:hypothetical protein
MSGKSFIGIPQAAPLQSLYRRFLGLASEQKRCARDAAAHLFQLPTVTCLGSLGLGWQS